MGNIRFVNNFIRAQPSFFKHDKGTKKDDLKVLREAVCIWEKIIVRKYLSDFLSGETLLLDLFLEF